jgi:hypothetical protein
MLLFLLPQIGSDSMQIVIQPLDILLANSAYFFNDWVWQHD